MQKDLVLITKLSGGKNSVIMNSFSIEIVYIYLFPEVTGQHPKVDKSTVLPTKSDSDVIFCLLLFSKTLTCTLHLSLRESRDHLCINPILWIGLIHK